MSIDQDVLDDFLHRFVGDLGATAAAGSVVIGHRLGLYRALARGAASAAELADRTGTQVRPVTEWLRGQVAGGYVTYVVGPDLYRLSPVQAYCLADPDGPVYLPGAFLMALGALRAEPRITDSFRTGTGVGWHCHDRDVFVGCDAFSRPGYLTHLTSSWIPALHGVDAVLRAGGRVADVGCGLGGAAVLMARAYPRATVSGSDRHDESIGIAGKRAAAAGVADRVRFEVASATTFSGTGYDLVTTLDCLHDMGDPVGAARHIRDALGDDGGWLLVEPTAGDHLTDNTDRVGRMYYGFSTLLCLPTALSQHGGRALGSQAGPRALEQVTREAGLTRFRRVRSTRFHDVYEVRR